MTTSDSRAERWCRPVRLSLALAVFGAVLATGCPPPDGDDTGTVDGDGGDIEADTGVDTDMPDTASDTGADDADGGDTDGDADAGGCEPLQDPETSLDRDRDGLPDDCDNYPFLNHGGDNPDSATVIEEREDEMDNDGARAGEAYDASFPFIFEGDVGPIGDDGDLDYVSFEVDEPTALLIKIESRSSDLWPGAAMLGYQLTNRNVQYIQFGNGTDTTSVREAFLPVPGQYSIALTDVRNLLPDSQTNDVGSEDGHEYRAYISKVPLPGRESANVPGTKSRDYSKESDEEGYTKPKRRLRAYEFDASSLEGVEIRATGTRTGDRGFHNPVVNLYDPDEGRTIAFTVSGQVDSDTRRVTLSARLDNVDGNLWVVEDVASQFRQTESQLQFSEAPVDSEIETVQESQNERASDLNWLQPGDTLTGRIHTPIEDSQNNLVPDSDYYLFSAAKGMPVELTVTPKQGSQLEPKMTYGSYITTGQSSRFFDRLGHLVPAADQPGDQRRIQYIHTDVRRSEWALRVRHGPNGNSDTSVGGPNYEYDVSLSTWQVQPATVSSIPGTAEKAVSPGGVGVVEIQPGSEGVYRVVPNVPDSISSFDLEGRVIRKSDWSEVASSDEPIEFKADAGETFWYAFRDDGGSGTEGDKVSVEIEKISPEVFSPLPESSTGTLNDSNPANYYKFSASEGDQIDIRLREQGSVFPQFRVYRLDDFSGVVADFDSAVFEAPADGDYLVKVSRTFDRSGDYELGVEEIQASSVGSLPATTTDGLDRQPFPRWYSINVQKDELYRVNLEDTGSKGFNREIRAYEGDGLSQIASGDGVLRFKASEDGTVLLAVFDNDLQGDPDYQFELTVETLRNQSLTVGTQVNGQLADGKERVVYTFGANAGGLEIDVESMGAWTPRVQLLDGGNLERIDDVRAYRGSIRYASAASQTYALLIEARDNSRAGPLQFSVQTNVRAASSTVNEQEPNNSLSDAQKLSSLPAVVRGDVGNSGDDSDLYTVDLQAGERIWILGAPLDPSNRYDLRNDLTLEDPDGNEVDSDPFGGNGFGSYPALYARTAPSSGTYAITLDDVSRSGDYYLYVYTSDVASATESEPNDSQGTAQQLGTVDVPTAISATVDNNDPTDIYRLKLRRDLDNFRVFLENANAGHELRLLDSSFSKVAADGPASDPSLATGSLSAGTYFVEVGQGNGGGSLDLILWPEP